MSNHVALSTSQFIGRQHELTLIWNQYKVACTGSARVVLLSGEPGIGKTRLLEEFTALAVEDGATILQGSASDFEGMPPYLPFLEAFGQYIRITPLELLREQVGTSPQILASILPELATRLGELPATYQIPPEQARLRLYEAIGTFLDAISTSNVLVLTLDDLHLADAASLDLPVTLSVDEASKILGVSRAMTYEAIRRGEVPSIRIGRRILIPRSQLAQLLGGRAMP